MHILIVEDEEHLAIGLKFNFEAEGYKVSLAGTGPAALDIFRQSETPVDLVVLDLMLPGMSGYETCAAIRALSADVPIMILSARTLSEDKTRAFELGIDQYVTKPFELKELLARVRNLTERRTSRRRSLIDENDVSRFGNARIDFRAHEVSVRGEPRYLTALELQLLRLFIENEGTVLSRAEILDKVWGISPAPATRTVDNFVMSLRRHFELDPSRPLFFRSVRGAGYRFVANPDDINHS